jgi:hypothetical protein
MDGGRQVGAGERPTLGEHNLCDVAKTPALAKQVDNFTLRVDRRGKVSSELIDYRVSHGLRMEACFPIVKPPPFQPRTSWDRLALISSGSAGV